MYYFPQYIGWSLPISFLLSTLFFGYVYRRIFSLGSGKAFFLSFIGITGGFIMMIFAFGLIGMSMGIIFALVN